MKAPFAAVCCLLLAACGGDPSPSTAPGPERSPAAKAAVANAYDALTTGDRSRVTALIADLDDAVEKDPTDGRTTFFSAIMRFWEFGDQISLASVPGGIIEEGKTMIDRFRTAQAAEPEDDRAPAFGGLAKVIIGNLTSDSALRTEGFADLAHGNEIFPAYSHFLTALASAGSPAKSDDFAAVLPEMQAVVDACRMAPGASGAYAYPSGQLPWDLRVCNDERLVPHVYEGFLLNYGDLLLKAGKSAEEARAAYEATKLAPRFSAWPFGAELQDRIDHASDRAALYADSDATNDPGIWMQGGHICAGCHQDQR